MLKSLKIYLYGYLNGVELYKVRTVVRCSSWDNYTIQAAVDNKHNLIVATNTINRNGLTPNAISLWSKINFGRSYFLFSWIKATIMEGKLNHNTTTIVAHPK
jgi:hypothetical protein